MSKDPAEFVLREYNESEWAVKRWDNFHRGAIVKPKSFCQFWRTVFLWATIAQFLPFIRPLTPEMIYEAWVKERERRNNAKPRKLASFLVVVVVVADKVFSSAEWFAKKIAWPVIWKISWPLRKIAEGIWFVFTNLVDFAEGHQKYIVKLLFGFAVLSVSGAIVAIGYLLYLSVKDGTWYIPLFFFSGFAFIVGGAFLLAKTRWDEKMVEVLLIAGHTISAPVRLLWEVALVSKKKICPPMVINRGNPYTEAGKEGLTGSPR